MIKLGIHRIGVQASALCAGLVWACSSGAMEAEPTHLREFAAYQAAFAKGDLSATIEHARTAWQAAELELGDSATTAILAYNYARSSFAYADVRDSAAAAYRRTLALSESGISDFRIADLQIGLLELNLQGQGQEEAALQLETLAAKAIGIHRDGGMADYVRVPHLRNLMQNAKANPPRRSGTTPRCCSDLPSRRRRAMPWRDWRGPRRTCRAFRRVRRD